MGKRTCLDIETADESVQKDVQHEEAQPKKKAKDACANGGVKEVQDLGSKTSLRTEARNRPNLQLHPRDADRITHKPKRSLRRDRVAPHLGNC